MATTMTVTRFEAIPLQEPQEYVVGFSVRLDNGREFYVEGIVSFSEAAGKNDQQIAEVAYAQVRADIEGRIADLGKRSPLIGQVFETENMRAERVRIEKEAAAEFEAAVTAAQKKASEIATVRVTESQEGEGFPGGRLSEESTTDAEERDDASADDKPPRRRRIIASGVGTSSGS